MNGVSAKKIQKQQEQEGFTRNRFNSIGRVPNAIITTILSLISLLMIVPMVLILIVSFSSDASISNVGFSFWPAEWSLEGYQYLF